MNEPRIPAFNYSFAEELPYEGTVTAKIRNTYGGDSWLETFKVTNEEKALEEIQMVLNWFNESRKDHERERFLVGIIRYEKIWKGE